LRMSHLALFSFAFCEWGLLQASPIAEITYCFGVPVGPPLAEAV
jgi:hypothetical protein